jgi:hypothetical protein
VPTPVVWTNVGESKLWPIGSGAERVTGSVPVPAEFCFMTTAAKDPSAVERADRLRKSAMRFQIMM